MKLRIAALLTAICMLLSGCMGLAQGTESLMRPPKLSVEQQRIYAALSAAVGDDVVLKYPGDGEYRSAFVMYDIDEDNEDEVIVFYTTSSQGGDEGADLRINILKKQGEDWFSIYDSLGLGPEIDSISFSHNITDSNQFNIVISFELLSMQQKILAVYSFKNNHLIEEFVCDYTSSLIQDFDNDGREELFLLYNVETTIAKAMYVDTLTAYGQPTVTSEVELSTDVKQYVQLLAEPEYADGSTAPQNDEEKPTSYKIYIDGVSAAKGNYTTELVSLKESSLTNLLVNDEGVHNTNWRNAALLTQDRNNDGVMDVPRAIRINDWPTDSKESALTLIEWYNYVDETFIPTSYTLVNRLFGFELDFPLTWGKNIAVKQSDDGYEWRIYEYIESKGRNDDSSKSSALGEELLRIRAYSNSNFFDKYSAEGYKELGKNEDYTFYAYIPEPEGKMSELAISFDELVSLFHVGNAK